MTARSIASSIARALGQSASGSGSDGGSPNPFVITPSTATPVAGADTTWSTNAGDLGTPVSYEWDFGDGTVPQTGATPSHYFVGLGPYTVTCVVTYGDDSTDTDTQVISPTAPAATSGQTISKRTDFTDDLTAANYNTTYDFDNWLNGNSTPIRSTTVGGKLAATSGVGYHCQSASFNWMAGYNIDRPSTSGINTQIGVWVYLEQLPASLHIVPLMLSNITRSSNCRMTIESNGSVKLRNGAGTELTTVLAGPVPLREWFWMGLANNSTDFRATVRIAGTETQVDYNYPAMLAVTPVQLAVGTWHQSANIGHNTRLSHVTIHTLTSIADAGYPNEVVPPQSRNHIYQVDPASGDDSNDGVVAPWQTITKTNLMLGATLGIISNDSAGDGTTFQVGNSLEIDVECGSGSHLLIDTSTEPFDVGSVGLQCYRPHMKIAPVEGQTYVEYKPWVAIGSGDWTSEGSNIYSIPLVDDDFPTGSDPRFARVWQNDIYLAKAASLAALSGEAAGAFVWESDKLYVKPVGLTNPTSDGNTYRYSRHRPMSAGDPVGFPVVSVASKYIHVQGVKCWYSTVNAGGSYVVGDITGFSDGLLVENFDMLYGDKHQICYTINATNSYIMTRNGTVGQGTTQPLTSYMGGAGSGNIHIYENIICDRALIEERSSTGAAPDVSGNSSGVFYSHGIPGKYLYIGIYNCDLGVNNIALEVAAAELRVINSNAGHISTQAGDVYITGGTLYLPPSLLGEINSLSGTDIVSQTGATLSTARSIEGTVTLDSGDYDIRALVTTTVALWQKADTDPIDVTFTNNTVRFNAGAHAPIFKGLAASEISEWNNNTYYMDASAVFVKDFDDGVTTADRTFAQWQALGYDLTSTRLDP
jgi:PKD repeat protein